METPGVRLDVALMWRPGRLHAVHETAHARMTLTTMKHDSARATTLVVPSSATRAAPLLPALQGAGSILQHESRDNVSQAPMGWLKEVAPKNTPCTSVTDDVFQGRGWLKEVAVWNMPPMLMTDDVSQGRGWSKEVAPSNMRTMSTTQLVCHFERSEVRRAPEEAVHRGDS